MAAETQYTANTGLALISTANAGLDGTGTLGTVLTGAANGTLVKNITIKGIVNTTEGMVRIFLFDGTNNRLLQEIPVPAVTKAGTVPAFEYTWNCDLKLKAGWILKASTQNANSFVITANACDWVYYTTSVRPESTNFTANTGLGLISAANANLDGTGTLVTILTAGLAATGFKGCRIECVTIKAIVNTTRGMVRLYLFDGTNNRLLTEVPVPAVVKSSNQPAFEQKVYLNNLDLKADWAIKASTQNAESFAITIEGNDWKYPA